MPEVQDTATKRAFRTSELKQARPKANKRFALMTTIMMLAAILPNGLAQNEDGNPTTGPLYEADVKNMANQENLKAQLETQYNGKSPRITVDSIEPEAGPVYGETRVLVRGGPFENMVLLFPHPVCKFGRHDMIVAATYVSCTEHPLSMEETEGHHDARNSTCLVCENSPAVDRPQILPLTISLTGDFSDAVESLPYRYFATNKVYSIKPRYGPKDGQTLVEVWGENFLNFDENTRCNFGSKSVVAEFINPGYLRCRAPFSDVTGKAIPFSVSLNKQQNTKEKVDYWYYNQPIVSKLVPNYGPDQGGNTIEVHGSAFLPFDFVNDINNANDTFCLFEKLGKTQAVVTNSTRASCPAPPNTLDLTVTFVEISLNDQNVTDDNVPYYYYKPPKLYKIMPRMGPTKGNTTVLAVGSDFKLGKKPLCKFGSQTVRGKMLTTTLIECVSPPVESPRVVPLSILYEDDAMSFESVGVPYTYYDDPIIQEIQPPCGPNYGYTQLSITGKNFVDMGFGLVKCVFNETIWMNATIVNEHLIKCSTPALSEELEWLPEAERFYFIGLSLNGEYVTSSNIKFGYYNDPVIQEVNNAAFGPVHGGTKSELTGEGFKQMYVCNLKVRYGGIETTPLIYNMTHLQTTAPRVNLPDNVVLAASGNGQNYAADYILHYRDVENTYTYIADFLITTITPQSGPTTGKTKLMVEGFDLKMLKDGDDKTIDAPLWVKFVEMNGNQIGNISEAYALTDEEFFWRTPSAPDQTKAIMYLSYNKQDWQAIIPAGKDFTFLYYDAPILTAITPHFGPVKNPGKKSAILTGLHFLCPDTSCKDLMVRFGDDDFGTLVPGKLLSSTQIEVAIPQYPKPDVLPVEITLNGLDYTNSNVTYGFYDAFLLDIKPRLISQKGTTIITMIGLGFVNSEASELKALFGTKDYTSLSCSEKTPCILPATYLDKEHMRSGTMPQNTVKVVGKSNSTEIEEDGMTVEVSVYEDDFTEEGLEIWYYQDPTILDSNMVSVPNNLESPLIVDVDFHWDKNNYERFRRYGNFTCRFEVDGVVISTLARMERMPLGSLDGVNMTNTPNAVFCDTPVMYHVGKGKVSLTLNGQDSFGDFPFEFTESLELYRISPQCGPIDGHTAAKLMGKGFLTHNHAYGKFGTLGTSLIDKATVLNYAWNEQEYYNAMMLSTSDFSKFKQKQHVLAPGESLQTQIRPSTKPDNITLGGPVYMSVGQSVRLPIEYKGQVVDAAYEDVTDVIASSEVKVAGDFTVGQNTDGVRRLAEKQGVRRLSEEYYNETFHLFPDALVEFYYYKNPQVKKIAPTSGLTSGGTKIEIAGAWFDLKPEYAYIPHCKIGDKVVRATFYSTVRIVCVAPPNDNYWQAQPVYVSQNGVDWVDSGFKFAYYLEPKIIDMSPKIGHMSGGTPIKLFGEHYSNITNPDEVLCKFTQIEEIPDHKIYPKTMPAIYMDEKTMACLSPAGFTGGDSVYVQLTFNGMDYTPKQENLVFSFYNLVGSFPKSGPADGFDDVIIVRGKGFKPGTHVMCELNKTSIAPVEMNSTHILCPMCLPTKDPKAIGLVKFGVNFDKSYSDFGNFYYYTQIAFTEMQPRYGPNEGKGIIYFQGERFRDDFPGVQIGCKLGDAIGDGVMIDPTTIKCVVPKMNLVDDGFSLPASLALNSHSWVGSGLEGGVHYTPYGIVQMTPNAGPYDGFTDIVVSGKGFTEDIREKAKCRFGTDANFAIVEAEVMDYTKLVCHSPRDFVLPVGADKMFSVPFGISFNDEEFRPWTIDANRFRFYPTPVTVLADPDEVKIGKLTEIFVFTDDETFFWEPIPVNANGVIDQNSVRCSFEDLGTSLGMYVNETTVICVSPHAPGGPSAYSRETVIAAIALNGQDYNEIDSTALVTFIGTGGGRILQYLVFALLLALLLLSCVACWTGWCIQDPNLKSITQQSASQTLRQEIPVLGLGRNPGADINGRPSTAGGSRAKTESRRF